MIIGVLRTRLLEKRDSVFPTEGGFYELPVQIDEAVMQKSGDVKSYANKTIGAYLASGIRDTEVPQEYWTFEFSERAQRKYGFPEFLNFGVTG